MKYRVSTERPGDMYFLLSGEGPTDMGLCPDNATVCEGNRHLTGPMAILVSKIVEQRLGFSFMDTKYYGFVSKKELVNKASSLKNMKKPIALPGLKKRKETRYFYSNARAMALCAKEKEAELDDQVLAVFFRDSDGTASADRGLWKHKWDSVLKGFEDEGFSKGVPMIPKPKSEAWIICALKHNPYQDCNALEERSGIDNSPNALKVELEQILGATPSRETLCGTINDGGIDDDRIEMPSFQAFREELFAKL